MHGMNVPQHDEKFMSTKHSQAVAGLVAAAGLAMSLVAAPAAAADAAPTERTRYKTIQVDGIEIFYREAGRQDAPAILLLHGFPSASHMFRDLIPLLADRYRVVAPDYPGFGQSATPDRGAFAYTFENLTNIVDRFTQSIGLNRYALYVMDYGAPIGFRLALKRPERVTAFVVQNGNAYEDGLTDFWRPLKRYWKDPSQPNRDALRGALTLKSTIWHYTHGVADPTLLNPDAWTLDQARLDRPGNGEIQLDLFRDYGANVALYPAFQTYLRERRPPTLVVWGKNDPFFATEGARLFHRDVPDAELHLLDTGHFALETHAPEIAGLIQEFFKRRLKTTASATN